MTRITAYTTILCVCVSVSLAVVPVSEGTPPIVVLFVILGSRILFFYSYFIYLLLSEASLAKTGSETVPEKVCFILHILGNFFEEFTKHSNRVSLHLQQEFSDET